MDRKMDVTVDRYMIKQVYQKGSNNKTTKLDGRCIM